MSDFFHSNVRRALLTLTIVLLSGFILGCGKKELTAEEVLTEAGVVRATGRLGESIAMLENYEQTHPGNPAIVEALAFDYMDAGDPATAAMYFARVAEIDSSQAEYLIWAAEAWLTAGDPDTAIAIYQQYLTLRPSDQDTRLTLAELYHAQGQSDAARDALLRINRDAPSGAIQVRIADLFLEGKNLAQAQSWYNSAAELGDDARDDAVLGLIEVSVRANLFADAEELVAMLDLEYPGALDNSRLANIRGQLRQWRQAQAAVVSAASQIAAPPPRGQIPPATGSSTPALTRPPTATGPATVTGGSTPQPGPASTSPVATIPPPAAPRIDRTSSAGPTFATPTASDPANLPDDLGEEYAQPDKDEMIAAAEREYEAALTPAETATTVAEAPAEESPGRPLSLFPPAANNAGTPVSSRTSLGYDEFLTAARNAAAAGRNAEAAKDFQRALARSSEDPQVWSELSEAQYLVGEVRMALASASEAVRRAPANAGFRLQYLRVLQGSAAPTDIIQKMEQARRDFPRNPSFTLVLARAHRDLGNARFARRYYQEFLRIAPSTHPDVGAAERELRAL